MRVPRSAPRVPSATPTSASRNALPITICSTTDESAPSAIRIPISRARCATEYAITP